MVRVGGMGGLLRSLRSLAMTSAAFAMTSLSSMRGHLHPRHCEGVARSNLLQHPVIANRRVGKCAVVKQSPRYTFQLMLSVLGGLLRLIVIRLAMTLWGYRLAMTICEVFARNDEETIKARNNLMNVYQ